MAPTSSSHEESLQNPLDTVLGVLQRHLTPYTRETPYRRPAVELVQECTARFFGLSAAQLVDPRRRHYRAQARKAAMYLARELTGLSTTKLAQAFRRQDHTTILYAYNTFQKALAEDSELAKTIAELRELIMAIHVELVDNNVSIYAVRMALQEWGKESARMDAA